MSNDTTNEVINSYKVKQKKKNETKFIKKHEIV